MVFRLICLCACALGFAIISDVNISYAEDNIFDRMNKAADEGLADLIARAEAGDIDAQVNLGDYYGENAFLNQDWIVSTKWYRRAAEQGHLGSQIYLAGVYAGGNQVPYGLKQEIPTDIDEALKWFRRAAEQNHTPSQMVLGQAYKAGQVVERDYHESTYWFRKAAKLGNPAAEGALGIAYIMGFGVEKNEKEAHKWILSAANKGYKQAQYNLGTLYSEGRGVVQDFKKAMSLFNLAAEGEKGDPNARYAIGVMHDTGQGVDKDASLAARWYIWAAVESKHAKAAYSLAALYEQGRGVTQSNVKAHAWFALSYSYGLAEAEAHKKRTEEILTPGDLVRAVDHAKLCDAWGCEL